MDRITGVVSDEAFQKIKRYQAQYGYKNRDEALNSFILTDGKGKAEEK